MLARPTDRVVFVKVVTFLRLLRLKMNSQISRQSFNQQEAKPKAIATCTHAFFLFFKQVTVDAIA